MPVVFDVVKPHLKDAFKVEESIGTKIYNLKIDC